VISPPLRRPEEILAFRTLHEILGAKPRTLWSVRSTVNGLLALQLMAEKDIGLVLVIDDYKLVGVLSERDCARRLVLERKPADTTPVGELMIRDVVTVSPTQTFADCLRLMHQHRIRHLPVIEDGRPIAVVSIRDLLAEAVAHHEKIISELERERLETFTSTA
jgi:signal-transduction protein with cAMP-binding, CBS, and nucleotidyltransferase domain